MKYFNISNTFCIISLYTCRGKDAKILISYYTFYNRKTKNSKVYF